MTLSKLLSKVRTSRVSRGKDPEVQSVCYDSRRVRPGAVFVAMRGARTDGARYLGEAIRLGAVAVVSEEWSEADWSQMSEAIAVEVPNAREALADLASSFYSNPSESMKVAGVTGTNGKTTTAFLLQHICDEAQLRCGLIGTVVYKVGEKVIPSTRTTPESADVQELLARMRDAGCKTVAMEVSSHALSQGRVRNVDFDAAIFTNLTQDHLDFHGNMDEYFRSKCLLFDGLQLQRFKQGTAVVNIEDRYGGLLLAKLQQDGTPTLTYGFGIRCDFRASNVRSDFNGVQFQLDALGRSWLVRLPLIGMFNVLNALAAISAAHVIGVDVRTAVLALANVPPVPGRLEAVAAKRSFRVFVDYAHTDDALRSVLRTLRELKPRRIITVFGCGGDRDRGKRSLMGGVAEELSDWSIVTSDNPRGESAVDIAADVERGMRGGRHELVLDRKEAIQRAVEIAGPRDIVLIAGKGHETVQEFSDRTEPFDDVAIARSAMESLPSEFGR